MGFLTDIFDGIVNLIRRVIKLVVDALGPILPLLIIAAFVFMPELIVMYPTLGTALGGVFATIAEWGPLVGLALGTGLAYLISPEGTTELISKVGDLATEVIDVAAGVIGDGIGALASAIFGSNFLLWAAAAFGIYLYVTRDEKDPAPQNGGSLQTTIGPGVY